MRTAAEVTMFYLKVLKEVNSFSLKSKANTDENRGMEESQIAIGE